jgi:site-specific recombinase XerD
LSIPPSRLELAIAAWLNAKAGRSQSSGTREKYERTLHSYQAALQLVGLDLDSSAPKAMGLVAQEWAARRSPESYWSGEVAPATFNNRLAIISSFFTFAARRELIPDGNPTIYVERRKTQQYARAQAIAPDTIREALQKIDRNTQQGKRDYALLVLGLSTGRRLSELAGLRCGDVVVAGIPEDFACLPLPPQ